MLMIDAPQVSKIVFTGDVFRIDDRSKDPYVNPQNVNVEWLFKLMSPVFSELIELEDFEIFLGDKGGYNSVRWKLYSGLSLPFETASWASIYASNDYDDLIDELLLEKFKATLAICFEAPPYLISFFERNHIAFIDFAIHPIRFLPDYMFGIRTNVGDWKSRIASKAIDEKIIKDVARVSSARTTRVMRSGSIETGSALFLGQLDVDAALIFDGKIAGHDEIERSLVELTALYPKVYFKRHPHCANQKELEAIVNKVKRCQMVEVNIYDAFGSGRFDFVGALSSGGVIEAKYFGVESRWTLDRKNYFDLSEQDKEHIYYPIFKDAMRYEFWRYVFGHLPAFNSSMLDPFEGAMKFNLNMKWGR